jgi:hypothetical protein
VQWINILTEYSQLMRGKNFIAKITFLAAVWVIVFGCTASRKNTYRQYLLTNRLKHNDSFIQEVFGKSKTEYFVTGHFIIVQKDVQFSEDSIIQKIPKHAYYILSTLETKQNAVYVYTDSEAKARGKDYEILAKDSVERMFLFKGFLKSLELDKYKKANVNKEADYLVHSFAEKGANFINKIAADSIVFISSLSKNDPFSFLAFSSNQQIRQIELHEKIEGNQLNSLFMLLTKVTANYQSATIDSILNKYKQKF